LRFSTSAVPWKRQTDVEDDSNPEAIAEVEESPVSDSPSIDDLVTRWQCGRRQGLPISFEDLADQPDQVEEVKRRLHEVASMLEFLNLSLPGKEADVPASSLSPTLEIGGRPSRPGVPAAPTDLPLSLTPQRAAQQVVF
jgi:hypothetical protein